LFDAYFAQAVFSVVVVVLGGADALFGLGSAVLVVAVVVFSEMQELVTADDILIARV
jgi:ABC-type branched-subunit amino acid transport system permease subunit